MAFPNEKEIKKMRKKLGRAQGFLMLSPDADELAQFRFKICQYGCLPRLSQTSN